ncbi:hypothetical protein [Curtobacterium sp. MCBA15_004]|uniref:hypothetical protein n=1 Tax=Curtobacterium sp. MCBA15_004 TaxID=1898733 RepID=UPI0015873B63|nr:hypothetical protein [Curtobacterium sp. MCBA15_004]WIA95838.1 hypothetical protein QOL16_12035 [Curtobacterium sp. MCBA15_004]
MRTVATLVALSMVAALFASAVDRYTAVWAALAWAVVVLFTAALLRLHNVINSPEEEQ